MSTVESQIIDLSGASVAITSYSNSNRPENAIDGETTTYAHTTDTEADKVDYPQLNITFVDYPTKKLQKIAKVDLIFWRFDIFSTFDSFIDFRESKPNSLSNSSK